MGSLLLATTTAAMACLPGGRLKGLEWPMVAPWYMRRMDVRALWRHSRGAGVTIAVLDSGVARLSALTERDSKISQIDDRLEPCGLGDRFDHGTRCVSLIASRDPNAPGLAPEAEVRVYQAFGPQGTPLTHLVAAAIEHAVRGGADIISCSLGLPEVSSALRDALTLAAERRVPVVVASGNDQHVHMPFPEDVDGLLTVGGIERDGRVLRRSRHGEWTRVFVAGDRLSVLTASGSYEHHWSGTSGSAALVSGLLAIGLSLIRAFVLTSADAVEAQRDRVVRALLDTADAESRVVDALAFCTTLVPGLDVRP